MKKSLSLYLCLVCLLCWQLPAYAARSFSVTLQSPAPAQFDMGTTGTGTFRITNTGNQDTITALRFRLNNGDHFSGGTIAPAGWTVTFSSASGGGYNTITFKTSLASGIPPGSNSFVDFPIAVIFHSLSADASERLRDVRATYTASGGGTTNVTVSNQPTWALKSLVVTLTPSSFSVARNCPSSFTLTMQVTNKSTASLTGVISVPKPPTLNVLSGSPPPNATTSSNPANLSLNAGASGTFQWIYSTNNNTGTISFTASAKDGAGTRTSRTVTSAVITVTAASCLIVDFNTVPPSPSCIFSGDTVTYTMHVQNNTGVALSNVAPSSLTPGGTAMIGSVSGPAPASVASLANGQSANFAWTVPVSGVVYATYTVSGTASGTNGGNTYTSTAATSAAADINGYILDVTPNSVNAFSTNQEMDWTITNYGCYPVKQVSLPIPPGWTWSGDTTNDAYSAVDNGSGLPIEDWTVSGGANAVFAAGTTLPTGNLKGYFYLTLKTPNVTSPTTTSFSATVTDTSNRTTTVTDAVPVTVDQFNAGAPSPNNTRAGPGTWREQFH